jgi:hypothetical protein
MKIDTEKLVCYLSSSGYNLFIEDNRARSDLANSESLGPNPRSIEDSLMTKIRKDYVFPLSSRNMFKGTFLYATKNLRYSDKEITEIENEKNLESLSTDSRLVFLVHGLSASMAPFTQDGRVFRPLRESLEREEICSYTLEYDDKVPFKEYSQKVMEEMQGVLKKIPCQENTAILGHSTGGDIVRYLVITDKTNLLPRTAIMAAPTTNGKIPDLVDKLVFGKKVEYCNPQTKLGEEILEILQKPVREEDCTLLCVRDAFIPLKVGLDFRGLNLIINNFGHLSATGCNSDFNKIYTAILKAILV